MPPLADIPSRRRGLARALLLSLAGALAAPFARADGGRLILGTHEPALAAALSVAVSPRGLSVMELDAPLAGVADITDARRLVLAHDAVAVVWLCDDGGARALCFCARDGRFAIKRVAVAPPLTPPDAAALALSVKLLLGAPAPASPQPPPTIVAAAPLSLPSPTRDRPTPNALGLTLSLLPAGQLSLASTTGSGTTRSSPDAAVAVALAPFFDRALTPRFALGIAPQIIFNVKASNDASSATEYDLRARATFRLPLPPRILVFGRVSPAYSIVTLPDGWAAAVEPGASVGWATGFLLDLSAGVDYAVSEAAFLVFDVGYQVGFQSARLTSATGAGRDVDYGTRYPHVGLGFGFALGR